MRAQMSDQLAEARKRERAGAAPFVDVLEDRMVDGETGHVEGFVSTWRDRIGAAQKATRGAASRLMDLCAAINVSECA